MTYKEKLITSCEKNSLFLTKKVTISTSNRSNRLFAFLTFIYPQ